MIMYKALPHRLLRLARGTCACLRVGPWHLAVWFWMGVILLSGCRHGGSFMGERGGSGLLPGFNITPASILLQTGHGRAFVRADGDATLVLSTHDQGVPMVMEQPGRIIYRTYDKNADRYLIGMSGPIDHFPGDAQVLVEAADRYGIQRNVRLAGPRGAAFAISVQRDIRLSDRAAVAGLVGGKLLEGLQVSGYESRTVFTNPGALPWPSESGVPYIRVEGDLWRSADVVMLFHMTTELASELERYPGFRFVTFDAALLGVYRDKEEAAMVFPMDAILPRLALLDRKHGVLTLLAYTAPMGLSVSQDTGGHRPDLEIQLFGTEGAGRWLRVATSGAALPLARGGSTRHHRQTIHVRGAEDALLAVAAGFCGLPLDDVHGLLVLLDGVLAEVQE